MRKYEKINSLSELFDEEQVRKNANGNEEQVIFARNLCKCLDDEGINANELGRRTGISKSSISAYINGEQKPTIIQLKKIAKKLKVSSDYLLGLSNLKSTNEDFKKVHKLTGLTDEAIMELKKQYEMANQTEFEYVYPMFKKGIDAINYLIANEGKYNLFKNLAHFLWFGINNKDLIKERAKVIDDNTTLEYSFDMMQDIAKIGVDRTLYKIKKDIDNQEK